MAVALLTLFSVAACGSSKAAGEGPGGGDAQPGSGDAADDSQPGSTLLDASMPSDAGPPSLRGHVAYVTFPNGASSVLNVASLDGSSAPKSLTNGFAEFPRFSRDGTKLYYSSQASSGFEIRQIAV